MTTTKHNLVGVREALDHLTNGGLKLNPHPSVIAEVEPDKQCQDQK
jgi:hypothetical protein